jgi:hypothetical protein
VGSDPSSRCFPCFTRRTGSGTRSVTDCRSTAQRSCRGRLLRRRDRRDGRCGRPACAGATEGLPRRRDRVDFWSRPLAGWIWLRASSCGSTGSSSRVQDAAQLLRETRSSRRPCMRIDGASGCGRRSGASRSRCPHPRTLPAHAATRAMAAPGPLRRQTIPPFLPRSSPHDVADPRAVRRWPASAAGWAHCGISD